MMKFISEVQTKEIKRSVYRPHKNRISYLAFAIFFFTAIYTDVSKKYLEKFN